MENSMSLYNLPNEILLEICAKLKNQDNFSLVCKKFYHLVTRLNHDNLKYELKRNDPINMNFNFDEVLKQSTRIELYITEKYDKTKNFDERAKEFFKLHGHRVIKLNYEEQPLKIIKFINFMPKLERLLIFINDSTEIPENYFIEKNSIPLKYLKMKSNLFNPKVFDILEMFDIEHFSWYSNDPPNKEIIERMIDFILNMKNLSKYSGFCNQEILAVLSLKNLNAIYLQAGPLDEEIIIKFLENTKTLKSFRSNHITDKILITICTNLLDLEELSFCFNDQITNEAFMNISKLKSLKILNIYNGIRKEFIESLCNFSLPHLEELLLYTIDNLSIENLANNFTKLKVLSVKIPLIQYHEGISKILKHFNNIEELEVLTTEQDEENLTLDENFFIENHKNTNLRFLQTPIPHNNFQNWMKKVSNDFPNIEYLLPVRAYYLFNEKFEKSFIDSNRHLFHVNLNSITNENELFKDCCYVFGVSTYENSNTMVKVIRDGKKGMVLNIDQYFKFCKLQAMMHTPRKLKSFSITLRKEENQNAVENCVKFLKLIGKDVKFFKISGEFTFYQLQKIIEVLPNLEIIKFKWIELDNLVDENLIQINHKNIKKLIFISKLCTNLSQQAQYFYNFFKVIRFNENSLNYFYFTVPFSLNIPAAVDRKKIDNFLENQKLLTKIEEKWSDELFKNDFVLEAKFDEL